MAIITAMVIAYLAYMSAQEYIFEIMEVQRYENYIFVFTVCYGRDLFGQRDCGADWWGEEKCIYLMNLSLP